MTYSSFIKAFSSSNGPYPTKLGHKEVTQNAYNTNKAETNKEYLEVTNWTGVQSDGQMNIIHDLDFRHRWRSNVGSRSA